MRIRRRPQCFSFQPSDPSTALQSAARSQECPLGGTKEGRLHPNGDLGAKSALLNRAALPQDNVVDGSNSLGAQQGAAGSHMSWILENGHHSAAQKSSTTCTGIGGFSEPAAKAEEVVDGGAAVPPAAVAATAKEEKSDSNGSGGGMKKRRSPAVLMEGSRCSRVNGRGWRCSQPTLVGYSLCEHHLGKGRMRSVSGGRGGTGQLGRTEPRRLAAAAPAGTAAPKAEEPSLRHC